jgi:hypothetical protein
MISQHELKTWPKHFEAIFDRRKPFEFRYNDRDYKVNDHLYLREWTPAEDYQLTHKGEYTGREIRAVITYILDANEEQPEFVPDNWVILGIRVISRSNDGSWWQYV